MLGVRRGMTRLGVVLLVLWELFALNVLSEYGGNVHRHLGELVVLVVFYPLIVWIC